MKSIFLLLATGLLSVVFGFFVILRPATVINIASLVFSIVLILSGAKTLFSAVSLHNKIKNLIGSSITEKMEKSAQYTFFYDGLVVFSIGVACFVIALYSLINNSTSILKAIVYIVAVALFLSSIVSFVEGKRLKAFLPIYEVSLTNSLAQVISSILLFAFPFFVGHTVMYIFGIITIVFGLVLLIWSIRLWYVERKVKKEEIVIEV